MTVPMTRRGFLKAIAALTGAFALPVGAIAQIEALAKAAESSTAVWPIGVLREIMAYDIEQDAYCLRYDVCTRTGGKLDVTLGWVTFGAFQENLPESRRLARTLIESHLKSKGKQLSDLVAMELPRGIDHALNL